MADTSVTVTPSQLASTNLSSLNAASSSSQQAAAQKRLRKAAQIIADGVRAASARFSKRIPESIVVSGSGTKYWVIAEGSVAPNAYPFETGARHPLFASVGSTRYTSSKWYAQPKRRFLEQGEAATIDAAMEEFQKIIDDWTSQLGWT